MPIPTRAGVLRLAPRHFHIRWAIASLLGLGASAHPQIVADPAAPAHQRPTVLAAPNGVPLVNIQAPSAAGVSRNTYRQFDVQRAGAVLNNSPGNAQTQLGGWVQGNSALAAGAARVILNEVNSSNPSLLKGYVEVAGPRAEVVIANPAGIQVDGGGFINAAGVTLTTGTPVMNDGHLERFLVRGGKVAIEGLGLDTRTADYTRILGRAMEVNAGLWARNLTVVTGANDVQALASGAAAQAVPIAAAGPAPGFLLDVAALGGMYAGSIHLVGTEAGLGVTNHGKLTAQEGTLVLRTDGWLVNTGQLKSQGDLALEAAGAITNVGAGAIIGSQALLSVQGGAGVSNTAGASMAASGSLHLATAGTVDNRAGSLQALGGVAVAATGIDNSGGGAILAQGDVVLTVREKIDNAGGTLAAGRDLLLQDPMAVRTLVVQNAGGSATAVRHASVNAASWLGAGTLEAGGDLAVNLQTDFASVSHLVAGGNAGVVTSGKFTNQARVAAGLTVTVQAAEVDNTATGEISGASTTLTATQGLTNRGLIDGDTTHITAGEIVNIGTGRIYGGHLAIGATMLRNDTETIAGQKSDAVIAARERLDLGVGTLRNREGAVVFSAGTGADALHIGGALDAQGHAIGSATLVRNDSATIESLGGLRIAAQDVRNTNQHLATEVQQVGQPVAITEYQLNNQGVFQPGDTVTKYGADAVVDIWNCQALCLTLQAPDGSQHTSDSWIRYDFQRTTSETTVVQSAPGRIAAAGDIKIAAGSVLNASSHILAGGALQVTGTTVQNLALEGTRTQVDDGTATSYTRVFQSGTDSWTTSAAAYQPAPAVQTIHVALARTEGHAAIAPSGNAVGIRSVTSAPGQPAAQVLTIASGPAMELPAGSLYHQSPNPSSKYLVETDPRFASYRQWLSSDYLLGALGIVPGLAHKRLGDGFYEQQLVREQVAQLTGRRFLDGYASDEAEYQALMAAGATFAQEWQLRPGIALTAEQMARLTTDIVWLVAREVVLPDGSRTTALVPQVYVRTRDGDLAPSGALLSGQSVHLDLSGDLLNAGTIAGRGVMNLAARDVRNLGEIIGRQVDIDARRDLLNVGGTVLATDSLVATAGRDLEVRTTTRDSGSGEVRRTNVDRLAGLYVTSADGALMAGAGRDAHIVAGVLASTGSLQLSAGRDLNLATVVASQSEGVTWDAANWRRGSVSQEVGAQISAGGRALLAAGNDLNARAATVQAGGALTAGAGRDVNIVAGEETRSAEWANRHTSKGFLSKRTVSTDDRVEESRAAGSSFGGQSVTVTAGRDVQVTGSEIVGDRDVAVIAGRDLRIEAATNTSNHQSERQDQRSGIFSSGGGFGFTIGKRQQETDRDTTRTTAAASTVGSVGGNVVLQAGRSYRQVGSDVTAPAGDIDISARDVSIVDARETETTVTEQRFKQSGLTVQISSPVLNAVQGMADQVKAAGETRSSRMDALAAANVAMQGRKALQALEAGQGSDNPAGQAGGIDVSVSIGSSSSRSTTRQESDTARGSSVVAGGDVRISATGAGTASDLLVRGGDIRAGRNVALEADGDVTLEAARNTASLTGSSSSKSSSVGASFGTSGFGITASTSKGRGSEAGEDLTHTNTHVTAGQGVSIRSGGDTALRGAVVGAESIQANVAGNLHVESLQDTSTYTSRQKSAGASVSIGVGMVANVHGAKTSIDSDYRSVTERSGLKAGDGGFQVSVGGDTTLVGGVLASNQAAVNEGRNSFHTGGQVFASDVQNTASYQAKASSVGLGAGGGSTGAGIGRVKGNAASVTKAGISGVAGDASVRSTDAEAGLQPIFDKDKVRQEVEAQVRITQAFGRDASKAIGDWSALQMQEAAGLRAQADAAGLPPEQRAALLAQAADIESKWGDYGSMRLLAHTVVGGLTGGASGAAGAAAGTLTAPAVADALKQAGVSGPLASALTAIASTAAGAAMGGGVGAGTALNEVANNYLKHTDVQKLAGQLKACGTNAKCRDEAMAEAARVSALNDQELLGCASTGNCDELKAEYRRGYAAITQMVAAGVDPSDVARILSLESTAQAIIRNGLSICKAQACVDRAAHLVGVGKGIAKLTPAGFVKDSAEGAYGLALAIAEHGIATTAIALVKGVAGIPAELYDRLGSDDPQVRGEALVDALAISAIATKLTVSLGKQGYGAIVKEAEEKAARAEEAAKIAKARVENNASADTGGFGTHAVRNFQPGAVHRAENVNAGQVLDRDGLPRVDEAKKISDTQQGLNPRDHETQRPAWMEGTTVTDRIVSQPERYRMVVGENAAREISRALRQGDLGAAAQHMGSWATSNPIRSVDDVRKDLAISSEWKGKDGERMFVVEFLIKPGVGVREGTVGKMFDANAGRTLPGGGHQIQFMHNSPRESPSSYVLVPGTLKELR